jgi:hypothetical protein
MTVLCIEVTTCERVPCLFYIILKVYTCIYNYVTFSHIIHGSCAVRRPRGDFQHFNYASVWAGGDGMKLLLRNMKQNADSNTEARFANLTHSHVLERNDTQHIGVVWEVRATHTQYIGAVWEVRTTHTQ